MTAVPLTMTTTPDTHPVPLRGICAAAITPVTQDLAIDVPRLALHVRWLLANGCDMVSVFGTTGEGPSFPVQDRLTAMAALIDQGIPAGRLVPGVMAAAAGDARRLMAGIAELGCRAGLIMPPFFFTGDDDGVAAFVDHAAGGAPDLPFLLYHYPAMSGFGYSIPLIARLQDRHGARLVGIKDSTGNLAHTLSLIARFPELAVFTGTDTDLLAVLAAGGAGIIGGVPNVNAALLARRVSGAAQDAVAADAQIAALFAAVAAIGGPTPIRTLLAAVHHDDAWLRPMPPLSPQDTANAAGLIAAFAAAGYRFGSDAG